MPGYTEHKLRELVPDCTSYREVLEKCGLRAAGGNYRLLKKWLREWGISVSHFPSHAERVRELHQKSDKYRKKAPLSEVMVKGSPYSRGLLKNRLFEEALKDRKCEMCGQGELWQGKQISLILDHINGIHNDHRLENLRILCPNCNATLPTHCGKVNRKCKVSGCSEVTGSAEKKFCAVCLKKRQQAPRFHLRKVERPSLKVLLQEVQEQGFSATGRKYGVSDNAVRKWIRQYQRNAVETIGDVAESG